MQHNFNRISIGFTHLEDPLRGTRSKHCTQLQRKTQTHKKYKLYNAWYDRRFADKCHKSASSGYLQSSSRPRAAPKDAL